MADSVREVLEQKGIVFRLNARVQSVKDSDVIYRDAVTGEEHQLHADAILLATGRRPNTAGLNLAAAGVEVNERGAIVVDDYLQTTNPKIHAIGDVKGGLQFTYISLDDYRILREDLFGAGERKVSDRDPVSYSVFIDPPLSRIGLSEAEARQEGIEYKGQQAAGSRHSACQDFGRYERIVQGGGGRRYGQDSGMYAVWSGIERGHQPGGNGYEDRAGIYLPP